MNIYTGEFFKDRVDRCYLDAQKLNESLNHPECPSLCELYVYGAVSGIAKNWRQKDKFPAPNNENEFKGIYLFGEETKTGQVDPVYVGISRSVFRRLRQHGWGRSRNEASFAFRLAERKLEAFEAMKERVRSMRVALLPIEDDVELYFSEIVVAKLLNTPYNDFRTH